MTRTIRVTFGLARECLRGLVTVLRSSPIRHMLTLHKGRKREREKEKGRERGAKRGQKHEPTYAAHIRGKSRRIAGWSCPETDKGFMLKVYSWAGSHLMYRYRRCPRIDLARMTTAHFLPFSVSPPHLHLTRCLPALSFVLRPLLQRIFDILFLTDALLYGPALLAVFDYLFHSRKQAKGTGSRDARWTITIGTVNRWQKDDRYASSIIYRN